MLKNSRMETFLLLEGKMIITFQFKSLSRLGRSGQGLNKSFLRREREKKREKEINKSCSEEAEKSVL